ncbi:unnamed protein product [Prorocentrum cordatum]|uniref:Uncharacterized protein n=1 Tax=Prorocentrum cordatum TaxID=2364126 RepID=A0ABN9QM38_9DINO|nr:unnamed protein product [Polarella glacialis]
MAHSEPTPTTSSSLGGEAPPRAQPVGPPLASAAERARRQPASGAGRGGSAPAGSELVRAADEECRRRGATSTSAGTSMETEVKARSASSDSSPCGGAASSAHAGTSLGEAVAKLVAEGRVQPRKQSTKLSL